jgi:hypothetical protein
VSRKETPLLVLTFANRECGVSKGEYSGVDSICEESSACPGKK